MKLYNYVQIINIWYELLKKILLRENKWLQ